MAAGTAPADDDRPALDEPVGLAKAVYEEMRAEDVPFMAGAIAYQAFVSLLPLLVLLVVVVAMVGDEQMVDQLYSVLGGQLPSSVRGLIENTVQNAAAGAGVSVIGIVTLAWGGFKIFRGLDKAFADLFDTERKSSLSGNLIDAAIVFGAIVVALLAMLFASSVFALFPELTFGGLLPPLLLVVGLVVAFLPMYYFFPDIDASVKEVVPGVVVAAVGWAALQAVFQVYVSFAGKSDVYGILGAVLVLVTWLYFSGLILLVGATLNAVIAGRTGRTKNEPGVSDEDAEEGEGVATIEAFDGAIDDLLEEGRRNGIPEAAMLAAIRRYVQSPADVWEPAEREEGPPATQD